MLGLGRGITTLTGDVFWKVAVEPIVTKAVARREHLGQAYHLRHSFAVVVIPPWRSLKAAIPPTLVVLGAVIRSGGGVYTVVVAGISRVSTTWLANNHKSAPGSTVCLPDG
jgi:hypothetical protein